MKNSFYIFIYFVIFSASLHAQEFAYVTDSLQLRIYSSASADSELLQTINSGDSVEVFATEGGFTQVTTNDVTVGWVKSAFLVEDPPAKLLYFSVSENNKQLEAELVKLRNEAQSNSASSSSEAANVQVTELQAELSSLQENNQTLQKQLADKNVSQIGSSTSVTADNQGNKPIIILELNKWSLGLGAVFLLVSFLFGLKVSSWRMKKRLHGFRL